MHPDDEPRIENHSGGECHYSLVDRYGELYPCEAPSVGVLVNASERWGGPYLSFYCKRHIWKALRGSRRDLAEEQEPIYA